MTDALLSDAERAALAREHLEFYIAEAHTTDMAGAFRGAAVPYAHHLEIIRVLTHHALGHSAIVMPRGAGKTILIQAYVEWMIGRASCGGDKEWAKRIRILLLSHSAHKAYSVSLAIMNTIEGPVYRAIFPEVKPSPVKWSQEEWRVAGNEGEPHPTFIAAGIDSPPLGGRFDLIIPDDIADEKNMMTGLQREKVRGTLSDTINPMLVPKTGRYIIASTRWAHDDPVWWAEARGFYKLERKALTKDEDGHWVSYWPERFPAEWLLAEWGKYRDSGNEKAFLRQYQNEVVPDEGLHFQAAWFTNRFDAPPAGGIGIIDSWDTASSIGRKRSSTAVVTGLIAQDYHIYIVYADKAQTVYGTTRDSVRSVAEKTGSGEQLIESKSTGEALLHDPVLTQGLNLQPWAPSGQRGASASKEQAAQWVTEYCARGWLHLPSEFYDRNSPLGGWLQAFWQDLLGYDGKDSPGADIVDALTNLVLRVQTERISVGLALQKPRELRWGKSQGVRMAL